MNIIENNKKVSIYYKFLIILVLIGRLQRKEEKMNQKDKRIFKALDFFSNHSLDEVKKEEELAKKT